jgi:hypothetical protein
MNWIKIDVYDEDANVPEVDQEILCCSRGARIFMTVAQYTGFWTWSDQPKRHLFFVDDGGQGSHIGVDYWRLLPDPPEELR